MTDDTPRDERSLDTTEDPAITALLRAVYAPPADRAYWDGLEERILGQVRPLTGLAAPTEWWQVMSGWARAGALAAGLAALLAGAALVETRADESQLSYEAVVEGAQSLPAVAVARSERLTRADEREATLRYVITH